MKITRFHRGIGRTPYEALFGGKPHAGLVSMNLGKLEDGVSAEEQLLEVLGDKNKEEENAEEYMLSSHTTNAIMQDHLGGPEWSKYSSFHQMISLIFPWAICPNSNGHLP